MELEGEVGAIGVRMSVHTVRRGGPGEGVGDVQDGRTWEQAGRLRRGGEGAWKDWERRFSARLVRPARRQAKAMRNPSSTHDKCKWIDADERAQSTQDHRRRKMSGISSLGLVMA